jgi:sulfate adenylyltransferase
MSDRRGCTVFLTGLSAAGKTTIALELQRLCEQQRRTVTLLDGDVVRTHLSSGLGFTHADRDANIRRVGFVAAEVTRHGGIAICACIAPYDATRKEVRRMVEAAGDFLLVHVATPLAACEARDPKGLYAKARAGLLQHFSGIDDPYEAPADADLVIDTTLVPADAAAAHILDRLQQLDAAHHGGKVGASR